MVCGPESSAFACSSAQRSVFAPASFALVTYQVPACAGAANTEANAKAIALRPPHSDCSVFHLLLLPVCHGGAGGW